MSDNVWKSGQAQQLTEKVTTPHSRPLPTKKVVKSKKWKWEIKSSEDSEQDSPTPQDLSDLGRDLLVDSLVKQCYVKCDSCPATPAISIHSDTSHHSRHTDTKQINVSNDSGEAQIDLRLSRALSVGSEDDMNRSDGNEVTLQAFLNV